MIGFRSGSLLARHVDDNFRANLPRGCGQTSGQICTEVPACDLLLLASSMDRGGVIFPFRARGIVEDANRATRGKLEPARCSARHIGSDHEEASRAQRSCSGRGALGRARSRRQSVCGTLRAYRSVEEARGPRGHAAALDQKATALAPVQTMTMSSLALAVAGGDVALVDVSASGFNQASSIAGREPESLAEFFRLETSPHLSVHPFELSDCSVARAFHSSRGSVSIGAITRRKADAR